MGSPSYMCMRLWNNYRQKKKIKLRDSLYEEIESKLKTFEKNQEESKLTTPNPLNKEYNEKLIELLTLETKLQDDFINWITGIASGGIFFCSSQFLSLQGGQPDLVYKLGFLTALFFATLLPAVCHKLFLHARFCYLKLEVEMLGVLWESHNLKKEIEKDIKKSGQAGLDAELSFLHNHLHNINLVDPEYIQKQKTKYLFKIAVSQFCYRLALIFFCISIAYGLFIIFQSI